MITAPPLTSPALSAEQLIGRDYLSYSALSTFQRCPLRFLFQYVQGLPPEFTPSSLAFGGAIHAAVERHFRALFAGEAPPTRDDLLEAHDRCWESESVTPIRFGKSETQDSLRDLANRMLAAFQSSPLSRLDTGLLAVEEELRGDVIPGCPDLLGRVDLIVQDGDTLRIIDFKTSRSRWGENNIIDAAPQMLLYAELARPLARAVNATSIRLNWIVLTKTKAPAVELHSLTPDADQINRQKAVVRQVWTAIRSGITYPCPSAQNCTTCPFQTTCHDWEG